jgi:MFS family permease
MDATSIAPRAPRGTAVSERQRAARLVAMASLIGTTIEWYDFIIYGTLAGVVLNKLFFPSHDVVVSTMLAYTTFAVGFLARPFGGLVFGHFGDRIGRKPLLVLTLTMMGAATFIIGLLPTYAMVGIAAPILLLVVRLLQGFALGGEWGGAVVMSFEYASKEDRGLYACFPQVGLAVGLCISTGVVALLSYTLSDAAFLAWGWRVAFMASIVLLVVGLFIRLRVMETPEFIKIKESYKVARVPIGEVLRDYPLAVLLGWGARLIDGIVFTIYAIFVLSYLPRVVHLPRTTVLMAITAAAFVLIFTIPAASKWSDRVDRGRLYIWFSLICGVIGFPIFWLMQYSGSTALAFGAIVLALGVVYAPVYGPQAALFCELFDTRVRYSGISLVYQIGAILSVSITPLIATALLAAGGDTPWLVALYMLAAGILSALSVHFMRRRT